MSRASTKTQTSIPHPSATRPEVSIRWVYRPLRARRLAIIVIASFVVTVIALVAVVTGKAYLAVLAGAATAMVVWRSYLPVIYELSYKGLRQTVLRWSRITPWNIVTTVRLNDNGFSMEGRSIFRGLDWRRELFVPWGEDEAVVRDCLMKLVPHLVVPQPASDDSEDLDGGQDE